MGSGTQPQQQHDSYVPVSYYVPLHRTKQGFSRVMTRPAGWVKGFQNFAGRVGSGRVITFLNLTGRIWSADSPFFQTYLKDVDGCLPGGPCRGGASRVGLADSTRGYENDTIKLAASCMKASLVHITPIYMLS